MKSIAEQFADVARAFPGATLTPVGNVYLVILPQVVLPPGWSQSVTHARFVVPDGFPYAPPDCFWADSNLRLVGGGVPKNTAIGNVVPGQPDGSLLWFSWHVTPGTWIAGNCKLMTYVNIIRNRFEAPE